MKWYLGGGAPDPKICTLEKNQVQNYVCPAQDEDVCHTTGQGLPMTTTWQAEDDEVRLHRTGGWGAGGFKMMSFISVKSTLLHHSLCSILTFGGLRKDLFFFSLLFLPLAWKVLQLSTRPSLVSWHPGEASGYKTVVSCTEWATV